MSGTTSFRRLACDWWNARSGSGRPLTLRDALDLAEFAHAAGRRAGLEEAGEMAAQHAEDMRAAMPPRVGPRRDMYQGGALALEKLAKRLRGDAGATAPADLRA